MIIQMFGMDSESREKLGRKIAEMLDAWYLDSRDLPMGHTQPQQARWLRVIAKAFDRNDRGHIITSGFFATKESREQYRIEPGRIMPDYCIYVDTIPHDQFHLIPGYIERVVQNVDNHSQDDMQRLDYWEEPEINDYDLIINKIDSYEDVACFVIEQVIDKLEKNA